MHPSDPRRNGVIGASLLAMIFGCQNPGSGHAAKTAPSSQEATLSATNVNPEILKRFCGQPPGPAPVLVKVLKDSSGRIGGYTHTLQIPDSPIYYLDAQGGEYAMFHIFASDQEKAQNQPLIDKLRKAYPIEEPLACP